MAQGNAFLSLIELFTYHDLNRALHCIREKNQVKRHSDVHVCSFDPFQRDNVMFPVIGVTSRPATTTGNGR